MNKHNASIPEFVSKNVQDGCFAFEGKKITDLIYNRPTPVFLYSERILEERVAQFREAMPFVDLYYCTKANATPGILQMLKKLRCGFSVATTGELRIALNCGISPEQIILAGAGKINEDLRAAVVSGVREIHADSREELTAINAEAQREKVRISICLRLNPGEIMDGSSTLLPAKPGAYGIDEEEMEGCLQLASSLPWLDLKGLHFYFGTQVLDIDTMQKYYSHAITSASKAAHFLNKPLETLSFGGGYGIGYYRGETSFDIRAFGERVNPMFIEARQQRELCNTKFAVEPGRFLVAEAGFYFTRVISVKKSRGQQFVVVDGGIHHHLLSAGGLGQIVKRDFPVYIANRLQEPASGEWVVTGRQSSALDTMARTAVLPEPKTGDILCLPFSGAYTRWASPLEFRNHPLPLEMIIDRNGELRNGWPKEASPARSPIPNCVCLST